MIVPAAVSKMPLDKVRADSHYDQPRLCLSSRREFASSLCILKRSHSHRSNENIVWPAQISYCSGILCMHFAVRNGMVLIFPSQYLKLLKPELGRLGDRAGWLIIDKNAGL